MEDEWLPRHQGHKIARIEPPLPEIGIGTLRGDVVIEHPYLPYTNLSDLTRRDLTAVGSDNLERQAGGRKTHAFRKALVLIGSSA